jgi:hypothetical protein
MRGSEAFVIGDGSSRLSHVPRVRRWDSGTAVEGWHSIIR